MGSFVSIIKISLILTCSIYWPITDASSISIPFGKFYGYIGS